MNQGCGNCNFQGSSQLADKGGAEILCLVYNQWYDSAYSCSNWIAYAHNLSSDARVRLAISVREREDAQNRHKELKSGAKFKWVIFPVILMLLSPFYQDIYNTVKYEIIKKQYQSLLEDFSKTSPILAIRPFTFKPYFPKNPQVEGQRKAKILAEVKIKNRKLAHNIQVKFDIYDGAGRRVDSEQWNKISGQRNLIFNMFYPQVAIVSWTPDIPNNIEGIAKDRENPFKLWLTVKWEGVDRKKHRLESYSELRYDENSKLFYFDERENKLL